MNVVTVSERKSREAARRAEAARAVMGRLRAFVETSGPGGRFIVFGSAASGSLRHDSDFDVFMRRNR